MTGALIILAVTALIGLCLWLADRRNSGERRAESGETDISNPSDYSDTSDTSDTPEDSEECCGMHAVCEKQLLSPVSDEIEYFDDEELDAYRGREPESYSEAEIEQFREILLTLPTDEVPAWSRSLQLRGIALPHPVRDELLLIVRESRDSQ